MNFSLVENIVKQNLEYQNGDNYTFATRLLMGYLSNKKDVIIKLPLTKIDGSVYLAKKYNREDLLPLIQKAAMDKDFQERDKAQKQLKQKLVPLYKQLVDDLYKECSSRSKPKVTRNQFGDYIIEYKTELGKPYIKFQTDKKAQKVYLISYHDLENVLKKKAYNDNSSYKFGSRETKAKIKQELENAKINN